MLFDAPKCLVFQPRRASQRNFHGSSEPITQCEIYRDQRVVYGSGVAELTSMRRPQIADDSPCVSRSRRGCLGDPGGGSTELPRLPYFISSRRPESTPDRPDSRRSHTSAGEVSSAAGQSRQLFTPAQRDWHATPDTLGGRPVHPAGDTADSVSSRTRSAYGWGRAG
jgi:hypothetical protein